MRQLLPVGLLLMLTAFMQPQLPSLPPLQEPYATMANAKTIAVAPVTSEKDEIDNRKVTDDLRKAVQKWLEKNAKKQHPWTWVYAEKPERADLVLEYQRATIQTGTKTYRDWTGVLRTVPEVTDRDDVRLVDGKDHARVLYAESPNFCFGCGGPGGTFLMDLQRLLEDEVKKAHKGAH